jgi:hypothetical protein
MKTIGGLRKTRHRGADRVGWMFTFAAAAYNLVRMRNLCRSPPEANTTTCQRSVPRPPCVLAPQHPE